MIENLYPIIISCPEFWNVQYYIMATSDTNDLKCAEIGIYQRKV